MDGCGLPVSYKGKRGGSIFQVNPQLQTVASSLTNIVSALNKAPKEWWREEAPQDLTIETGVDQTFQLERVKDDDEEEIDSQKTDEYPQPQFTINSPVNCSPINVQDSQDINDNDPNTESDGRPSKKQRVKFQQDQQVSQTKPLVFIASKLSKNDKSLLQDLHEDDEIQFVD